MSLRKFSAALAMIVTLVMTGSVSNADEFHYNNMLIGDRAAGMGGAYAGISDDPSGLYYNPAGIVYATGRNLSASLNSYFDQTKKYDSVIGGLGWERRSTSLLPNFFGIIQPLGKFKFGFSYAVPDSIREDQDQTFTGSFPTSLGQNATKYTINFNNEDTTYLLGPSLAMELNSKIAAGMTLYLYHRSNQSVLNQFILLHDGTSFLWENSYIEKVERGYKPVLGVMIAPMDKLSIGLSLAKTFVYSSSVDVQSTGVDQAAIVSLPTTTGDSTTPKYPLEVRLGAAYFPTSSLLLSADLSYYTKVENPNGDRVNVTNLALGTEYFLDKNWAVRGGLFTNMANSPELDSTRFNQDEKVDLYGMSLSISNFTRNTSVSFGGSITSGSGKAQIQRDVSNIQNVDVQGWLIFLSSSYSY